MTTDSVVGVVIDCGITDWQILQQDSTGTATVRIVGRWRTDESSTATVVVRVVHQNSGEPVTRSLDWHRAITRRDHTWSVTLKMIPAGGLYRLETGLQLPNIPKEWARRGDMVHHFGVGDVWLITGQSNAAGYGRMPIHDPPEIGIHMFRAAGQWTLATHPLADSTQSRYPANRENVNPSHSPWLAFARRLKERLGYPIGLIPTSLGGSRLRAWNRSEPNGGALFDTMLEYVRDAGGKVRGAVWYQGESDTAPDDRKTYSQRFQCYVRDLRRSLRSPQLPIITAQLNHYVGFPFDHQTHADWEAMREIQRRIAQKQRNVYVISTLDVGLSDAIHNDANGNLRIGVRMANTALGAIYGHPIDYACPDCSRALLNDSTIDLFFDNVTEQLHYDNLIVDQFPFAVRDRDGDVPITAIWCLKPNGLRLELERPPRGRTTVTGAQSAAPPTKVPIDISGYRPMLGFTVRTERKR